MDTGSLLSRHWQAEVLFQEVPVALKVGTVEDAQLIVFEFLLLRC